MKRTRSALLVLLTLLCASAPALAQSPGAVTPLDKGRILFTVGGELLMPAGFGNIPATMQANNPGSASYTYFNVDMKRATAPAFRATLGYLFTPTLAVEAGFAVGRGKLNATISNDAEHVPGTVITSNMTQYVFDASLVAHLSRLVFSNGAALPFLDVGAGYLRQAQAGNFAIESGQIYHFGGGVDYMVPRQGRASAIGFRANARIYVQRKGYSPGSGGATYAAIGGALLMVF